MKLIGIEEHFLTRDIREAWNAIALDAVDPNVAFHAGAIEGRLLNLAEGRLALKDEAGLDVQVLSLTTPALHELGPGCIDTSEDAAGGFASRGARCATSRSCVAGVSRRVLLLSGSAGGGDGAAAGFTR